MGALDPAIRFRLPIRRPRRIRESFATHNAGRPEMAYYRVNNNVDRRDGFRHEVHDEGCYWYTRMNSYTQLGCHLTCYGAVVEASGYWLTADGCGVCSPACHSG